MIVNFHKSEEIGAFSSLHHVTFEENKNWNLSLLHFICKFKHNLDQSGIYQLSSNLIQRDDGNIHRALFYMYLEKGTNHVDITPTQSYKYKLRLYEISSAEFSFCLLKTQEIIPISEAAFQLDIVESYGRFQ